MAAPETTREQVRNAYIEQRLSMDILAAMFGVSARSIQRWKEESKKQGDDWDKAQSAALLAGDDLEQTTYEALAALVCQIKGTIEAIDADPEANAIIKAQALASLIDALHKATHASRRLMPQANKLAVARETMRQFAQFAQLNHPEKSADLVEVIEAFGSHLPRVFKE